MVILAAYHAFLGAFAVWRMAPYVMNVTVRQNALRAAGWL